ncbi:ABC transporter substrate-binding protein [soil metagenome]
MKKNCKFNGLVSLTGLCIAIILFSCNQPAKTKDDKIKIIGFLDYVEDPTLALSKKGFLDALADSGFSEGKNTLEVIYKNAQGDQPTLLQAADLLISKHPILIATNTTLATVNTVQRTKEIPVFMMVSPRPDIAKLTDTNGKAPANLFGIYETLDYIDTSVTLITKLFPKAKKVGTVYSQSESQSVDALNRLKAGCSRMGLQLELLPVTNSSETQLVVQSLLNKNIDVFFALPDNVIFSSFETIARSCNEKNIPILTSEAGLVSRGAIASYGADFYQWGYQSGLQAAQFLKQGNSNGIAPEIVQLRNRVYNPEVAKKYNVIPDSSFSIMK